MTQSTYNHANQSGAAYRAAINGAQQAAQTGNSGSTLPTETYPFMIANDTATAPTILVKQRDAANSTWITIAVIDASGRRPYRNGAVLGDAAIKTVGAAVGNVPVLVDVGGGVAGLAAIDGSLLTNLPIPAAGSLIGVETITASGSYARNTDAGFVVVYLVAGGASGASTDSGGGGGGGGSGGLAIDYIDNSLIGATESVTIGGGGAGVTNNFNGNNGASSLFGAHCSASGGVRGQGGAGGNGGAGSGATINLSGQKGPDVPGVQGGFQLFGGQGGRGSLAGTTSEAGKIGICIVYEYK